jgi:hypothetical protein
MSRCYGLNWDGYKFFALEHKFVCWTCCLEKIKDSTSAAEVNAVLSKLQRLALKRRCECCRHRADTRPHRL